jgi:hypothetical protein
MTGSKNRRISKIKKATRRMTWRRGNHIAVATQKSGVACDAVHMGRRAAFATSRSGREREWRQRECRKMYLTEIVNDTLAARRFRLLAPLALLLALVALALAPGIIGN